MPPCQGKAKQKNRVDLFFFFPEANLDGNELRSCCFSLVAVVLLPIDTHTHAVVSFLLDSLSLLYASQALYLSHLHKTLLLIWSTFSLNQRGGSACRITLTFNTKLGVFIAQPYYLDVKNDPAFCWTVQFYLRTPCLSPHQCDQI